MQIGPTLFLLFGWLMFDVALLKSSSKYLLVELNDSHDDPPNQGGENRSEETRIEDDGEREKQKPKETILIEAMPTTPQQTEGLDYEDEFLRRAYEDGTLVREKPAISTAQMSGMNIKSGRSQRPTRAGSGQGVQTGKTREPLERSEGIRGWQPNAAAKFALRNVGDHVLFRPSIGSSKLPAGKAPQHSRKNNDGDDFFSTTPSEKNRPFTNFTFGHISSRPYHKFKRPTFMSFRGPKHDYGGGKKRNTGTIYQYTVDAFDGGERFPTNVVQHDSPVHF